MNGDKKLAGTGIKQSRAKPKTKTTGDQPKRKRGRPKGSKTRNIADRTDADYVLKTVSLTRSEKISILKDIAKDGKDVDKIRALSALNELEGGPTTKAIYELKVIMPCDKCPYNPANQKE